MRERAPHRRITHRQRTHQHRRSRHRYGEVESGCSRARHRDRGLPVPLGLAVLVTRVPDLVQAVRHRLVRDRSKTERRRRPRDQPVTETRGLVDLRRTPRRAVQREHRRHTRRRHRPEIVVRQRRHIHRRRNEVRTPLETRIPITRTLVVRTGERETPRTRGAARRHRQNLTGHRRCARRQRLRRQHTHHRHTQHHRRQCGTRTTEVAPHPTRTRQLCGHDDSSGVGRTERERETRAQPTTNTPPSTSTPPTQRHGLPADSGG